MDEGGSRDEASLSEEALLLGTLGYERKAPRMSISLHGGSAVQPGVGPSTGDIERWLKVALEVGRFSLWEFCEGNVEGGLPCKEPWRIGRKGSVEGRRWGTWKGLIYQGLQEMNEGGSRNGAFLSEEAQCGGPLYWGPWKKC